MLMFYVDDAGAVYNVARASSCGNCAFLLDNDACLKAPMCSITSFGHVHNYTRVAIPSQEQEQAEAAMYRVLRDAAGKTFGVSLDGAVATYANRVKGV